MASFVERTRCPACGGGAVDTLLSRDFAHPSVWPWIRDRYAERVSRRELAGRRHEIARCGLCRLLFQRYVLADASLVRLYDVWTSERQDADRDGLPDLLAWSSSALHLVRDLARGDGDSLLAPDVHSFPAASIHVK